MSSTNPQAFSGASVLVRDLPPTTGSRDALRACSSRRGCRCARRSGCSAVLPLHMPSHQRGWPASTVARLLCAPRVSAAKRPKPRRHPCCEAHGRLRDALRREAPERGRRPAIAICPTQPFPTGLQAPGARRWPRLPVPPSLAERMPSLAGTASKEAIHSESQAPGCSAQLS